MADLKAAIRSLTKSPGFSLVAVLTIALGIAANTALFSVYDRLVLNPVTIQEPVVAGGHLATNPQLNCSAPAVSWPRYEDDSRSALVIFVDRRSARSTTSRSPATAIREQLNGLRVTPSFFPTLGVMPARGRNFTPDEDAPNGPAVCIISHELWQTRFGGRAIAGRQDDHAERTAVASRRHPAAAADARRSARCRSSRHASSKSAV